MALLSGKTASTAEITELLHRHGITSTLQRVEIAQALYLKRQHVSAEQILKVINKGRRVASKATVYNTLRLFVDNGLIREIIADPSKVFYEPTTTYHHHYFDVDTRTLIDIENFDTPLDNYPRPADGSTVLGVDIIIRISSKQNN